MAKCRPVALRRLHPAVGEFVIQYAVVQGTARTLLLALLKISHNSGGTLVYGMSDDVVLKKLKLSLKQYGNGYTRFGDALDRLRTVTDFRNKLLHWVPNMNPSRTTLAAFVDAFKDYTNPNEPQITCTPGDIRLLTKWLLLFEGDLAAMLMALANKERFDAELYRTIQSEYAPPVPKQGYPETKPARAEKR